MRGVALSSCFLILLLSGTISFSQVPCPPGHAVKPESVRPEIPDEPKTVDPATLVPEMLAKKITVEFKDASLREVMTWISETQNIQILIDPVVADEFPPLDSKVIIETLKDAPLYLLLDRLESLELSWYVEDEILFLTTLELIHYRRISRSFNLSDLLNAGYTREEIKKTIRFMLSEVNWGDDITIADPEVGELNWFDDALFIRQTRPIMRQCAGLFEALRQPSHMRFTYDSPAHESLRKTLETRVTVDFDQVPLNDAIGRLAGQIETDIRFDHREFDIDRSRERVPVTLKLTDGKLSTVLNLILEPMDLTWILKNGAILITSIEEAEMDFKVAVYLIGDLCQNEDEAKALFRVIMQQTVRFRHWGTTAYWDEEMIWPDPEKGVILSPRQGVMVVREKEPILLEIKTLLDNYRTERPKSDTKKRQDPADEILTRYYRMHSEVADDLEHGLPLIVAPGSWVSESNPDGPGQVLLKIASPVEVQNSDQPHTEQDAGNPETQEASSYSVLVIKHQRKVHEQIEKIFDRIENGDLSLRDERLKRIVPAPFGSGSQ